MYVRSSQSHNLFLLLFSPGNHRFLFYFCDSIYLFLFVSKFIGFLSWRAPPLYELHLCLWALSSYDLPCSDCKHFTLACPDPCYFCRTSLQFLRRSKHTQDLCTCCSSSLGLFIQVSFWLALSLHCNLCLYVIWSHICYHITEGPSWSPAVTAPITSILHSGLFPFFLFYPHLPVLDILLPSVCRFYAPGLPPTKM